MTMTKVFKTGGSQAVRIPKQFRFQADEVEIVRRGREIVLSEKARTMSAVLDLIQQLPDEMMDRVEKLKDAPPQRRKRA